MLFAIYELYKYFYYYSFFVIDRFPGLRTVLVYFSFMMLCILILEFLKKSKVYLFLLFVASLFYALISFLDVSHYLIFKNEITASTIYIILKSNSKESQDFLEMYLNNKIISIGCTYIVFLFVGLYFAFKSLTNLYFSIYWI